MENTEMNVSIAPGTPVYVVTDCCCGDVYAERCKTRNGIAHGNQQALYVVPIPNEEERHEIHFYKNKCKKIHIHPFEPNKHLPLFGKTVFLSLDDIKEIYSGSEMIELRKDMNMKETKHMRFQRLAEARTNKAIKAIELIGNLATPINYSYSDEEAKQIVEALRKTVDAVEAKLSSREKKPRPRFRLDANEEGDEQE